jgi:hypothetical protein
MTFEELSKTVTEQNSRIFRFEASLSFFTFPSFTKDHFRALPLSYINNASWELIKKTNFPFENIITAVDFVYGITETNKDDIKTVAALTIKFSVTILNQPDATVDEFAILIRDYFNGFGEFLINMFKIPMELKSSEFILDLPREHKIYQDLINNAI